MVVRAHAAGDVLGHRVGDVLTELRSQGLIFIYNTQMISDALRVRVEPQASGGVELAREILGAHGLSLLLVAPSTYAVVRQEKAGAKNSDSKVTPTVTLAEVVVQTSRYALTDDALGSRRLFNQAEVKALPRLGDETLRAVQRLPGSASNGFSSLGALRGGAPNETGILLDGMRLSEPFHLKNFLSPVSLLDARLIDSMDVYSGGFSAQYGDRMSAMIDAKTVQPAAPRYYELGLSLFHLHGLGSFAFNDDKAHVLVTARRSNLPQLSQFAESDFGTPSYSDGFARLEYAFSATTRGSLNALLSSDEIVARKDQGRQSADATYRNSYIWGALAHDWSPRATTQLLLGFTDVTNNRYGQVDEPGQRSGKVSDQRTFRIANAKLSSELRASVLGKPAAHHYGVEVRELSADYRYASQVSFAEDFPFPGSPARQTQRSVAPTPEGNELGAYWDTRIELSSSLAAQIGLRADNQSEYGIGNATHWSPRVSVLYAPHPTTHLRASWGRFFQAQSINELQVEDGIDRFYPAQRADHAIVSIEQTLRPGIELRLEIYRKQYRHLQPRYENLFNPLSLLPEVEFDRVVIAPTSARAEGAELLFTAKPSESWNAWFGYTWSRVQDRVDGRDVLRSWDQTHAFNLGVVWTRGAWSVTLADLYHTGWPTTELQTTSPFAVGARNGTRLSAYHSLDLRVSRMFDLSRGELDVYLEVANATKRSNACCTRYSAVQDANGTTVLTRDTDYWLEIVPSAGVLWRY